MPLFFLKWKYSCCKYYVSFRCITWWFDIFIHYKMITMTSLAIIYSWYKVITILLTIFLMLYITSLWLIYFITGALYLLIPTTYSLLTLNPVPSGINSFVYIYKYVFILFCLFCLLNSTLTCLSLTYFKRIVFEVGFLLVSLYCKAGCLILFPNNLAPLTTS